MKIIMFHSSFGRSVDVFSSKWPSQEFIIATELGIRASLVTARSLRLQMFNEAKHLSPVMARHNQLNFPKRKLSNWNNNENQKRVQISAFTLEKIDRSKIDSRFNSVYTNNISIPICIYVFQNRLSRGMHAIFNFVKCFQNSSESQLVIYVF